MLSEKNITKKENKKAMDLWHGWNNCYIFLILMITLTTSFYHAYPWVVFAFIAIEISALIFHNYFFLKLDYSSDTSFSWINRFVAKDIHYSDLVWSGFALTTLLLYDLNWPGVLVILVTFSLVFLAFLFMAPMDGTAKMYVFLMLAPLCIWGIIAHHEVGFVVLFFSLFVCFSMIKTDFWWPIFESSMSSINKRTSELVRINRELEGEILYRKNMEKALRKSEERYRTLFQNNPIETIIVDHQARITGYNSAKARSQGRVPEIGDIMYKDYGAKHSNNMYEELMDCIRTGCAKEFPEQKYNERFLHIRLSPYSGGAIITSLDITKSKRAEEQIQTLTREIMRVQENERQRIARDLHDSVAQDLSSLRISCETFFDEGTSDGNQVRRKINEISKILHGSINAVRDIAYELRPPCLDELGLPITLFRYCEDFTTRTGIHVDFFSAGLEQFRIDAESEINLYRLVQEALNNVRKHSKATRATIRLVASYPYVILRIDDNGVGFEAEFQSQINHKHKHMGLRSMEERVNLLGGRINVKSCPGSGTRLFIEVPIIKKFDVWDRDLEKNMAN